MLIVVRFSEILTFSHEVISCIQPSPTDLGELNYWIELIRELAKIDELIQWINKKRWIEFELEFDELKKRWIEFELEFDELKKWWIEFELKFDELKKWRIEFELRFDELKK